MFPEMQNAFNSEGLYYKIKYSISDLDQAVEARNTFDAVYPDGQVAQDHTGKIAFESSAKTQTGDIEFGKPTIS